MIDLTPNTVFDYKTHAENFKNYCEVVIYEDGKIEYAVPSHQEKAISIYCKNHNISRKELWKLIPFTESPLHWICYYEGLVSVWYEMIVKPENITKEQKRSLARLVLNGCIDKDYKTLILGKNDRGGIYSIQGESYD